MKNSDRAASYLVDRAKTILDQMMVDRKDMAVIKHNKDGTTTTCIRFEHFLEMFRSLPLLYVPVQHDIQGILAGQTITAIYRYLKVIDDNQPWFTLTVSAYSSLSSRMVIMSPGNMLLQEVICQL